MIHHALADAIDSSVTGTHVGMTHRNTTAAAAVGA